MSNPIQLGILGCGRIATRRMLPALQTQTAAVSAAIASQRAGVAQTIADEFKVHRAYDSYEALLADEIIDAVYLPAAGDEHHRWTIEAAEAGKHVLCEKPLAPTVQQAEEMVQACNEAGVILQEAFMWRHHPRATKLKELISNGTIGQLRMINVSFSFDIDRNDWRLDPNRGGGAMWDLGCYGVNCSRFVTGAEPETIEAAAHWYETGADMTMRINLTFPDAVLANIDCSFELPFRSRAEFVGDGGRILVEKPFQPFMDANIHLWKSTDRDEPEEIIECGDKDQWAAQVEHFCASIHAGKLLAPAESGLNNMRILETVLKTARANS